MTQIVLPRKGSAWSAALRVHLRMQEDGVQRNVFFSAAAKKQVHAHPTHPYTKNVLMNLLLVMGHMRYPGRLTEACLDEKECQTSR